MSGGGAGQMFWFRSKVSREEAVTLFLNFASTEAGQIFERIADLIRELAQRTGTQFDADATLKRPLMTYRDGGFVPGRCSLLEAHCRALLIALEVQRFYQNGSQPPSRRALDGIFIPQVFDGMINARVASEEVGSKDAGHAPPPWVGTTHVSWFPGTLVGGIRSREQELLQIYGRHLRSAYYASDAGLDRCLVMLLLSIGVIRGNLGIGRRVFQEIAISHGVVGRNIVGVEKFNPEKDRIGEWEGDLVIFDPHQALESLPSEWLERLRRAFVSTPDFWPEFFKTHRLSL